MLSKFEHLPNEIILYIFDYLKTYHAVKAFDGLNYRLNSMVKMCWYTIECENKRQCNVFIDKISRGDILPNRIRALTFYDAALFVHGFEPFWVLTSLLDIKIFINLRSLKIVIRTWSQFKDLFEISTVFEIVHELKGLINLEIAISEYLCENKIRVKSDPLAKLGRQSTIRNFTISVLDFDEMKQLFLLMPKLKYLNIKRLISASNNINPFDGDDQSDKIAPHLTRLQLHVQSDFEIDHLVSLLQKLSTLRKLSIHIDYFWKMINEQLTKDLIERSLPPTTKLQISFRDLYAESERAEWD